MDDIEIILIAESWAKKNPTDNLSIAFTKAYNSTKEAEYTNALGIAKTIINKITLINR